MLEVVKIDCAHRRTWFIGDDKIDSMFPHLVSCGLSGSGSKRGEQGLTCAGGTLLMHVPVDPLFLVIPIVLSLISSATHFQPLSDLVAQASVNPDFALPEPFSREAIKGGGFNEDVGRLLAIKSVRRVFKLCCEKKGTIPTLRLTLVMPCLKWEDD